MSNLNFLKKNKINVFLKKFYFIFLVTLVFGSIFLTSCSKVAESTTVQSSQDTSSSSSSTPAYSYLTATFTLNGVPATNITETDLSQSDPPSIGDSYSYKNSNWDISPKGKFSKKMPLYSSFFIPNFNLDYTFYVTENAKSYFFVTSNIKYDKNKNLDLGTIDLKPRVIVTGVLNLQDPSSDFYSCVKPKTIVRNGFFNSEIFEPLIFTRSQLKIPFSIEYSYGANVSFSIDVTRDSNRQVKTLEVNIPNSATYASGSYDVGEIPVTVTY